MDLTAIVEIISQVGFPIACCIVLFKQNAELNKTLNDISATLQLLSERVKDVESKLNK